MPRESLWTPSQLQAWDYVKHGNELNVTQSQALEAYREGGGHIRTGDWGELWNRYKSGSEQWDRLYQFRSNDTLPESMYTQVGTRYQEKYVMTFTASIRDSSGAIIHDVKRQVESSRRLTVSEWASNANQSLQEDISIGVSEVLDMTDVSFYERID